MVLEQISKRDHIMDVAEELFAEHGFEATSTRMIATAANVNLAMLSYYFGGKEPLFQALVERKMSYMKMVISNLKEDNLSAMEKLERVMDAYIERVSNNRCFNLVMHRELSMNQRTDLVNIIVDNIYINVQLLRGIIQEGQSSGEFRQDVDIAMLQSSMFGTIFQFVHSPVLSLRMLNEGHEPMELWSERHKKRMGLHLLEMMRMFLVK